MIQPTKRDMEHYRASGIKPSMKRGIPYPGCTQEDLDELLYATDRSRERFKDVEWKPISLDDATERLEKKLAAQPGPRTQAARDRLNTAINNPKWTVDLVYKTFYDLDKAFFGGIMRGKVKLRWKGTEKYLMEACGPDHDNILGITWFKNVHEPVPVVDIFLNAKRIFCGPTWTSKRRECGGLYYMRWFMVSRYLL